MEHVAPLQAGGRFWCGVVGEARAIPEHARLVEDGQVRVEKAQMVTGIDGHHANALTALAQRVVGRGNHSRARQHCWLEDFVANVALVFLMRALMHALARLNKHRTAHCYFVRYG